MKNFTSLLPIILLAMSFGSQAKSLTSYKYKSVPYNTFMKEIYLECYKTVDCKNHKQAVRKVAAAYRAIKNSPSRTAKAYAKSCLDGFSTLNSFPKHLQGQPGVYYAQFMACNAALEYHFVK